MSNLIKLFATGVRRGECLADRLRRKPASVLVGATLLAAALAFSCTASPDAMPTAVPETEPTGIAVATDDAPAVEVPTAPEDLKVFRMPITQGLIPDPHHAFDAGSTQLVAELFSGLMRYHDYDDRIEVEGDLAESHSVSDDGLTYTFRLRNDLRFSNGSPVTAADFKWTWERALTEGTWERIFENLSPIGGADALIAGEVETLTGVEVIDDRTLRVRLETPRADFLMRLADPTAVVLSPGNVSGWGTDFSRLRRTWSDDAVFEFDEPPVGTGPFRLGEFHVFGPRTTLHPNGHYLHGVPEIDAVELLTEVRTLYQTGLHDFDYRIGNGESLYGLVNALSRDQIHVLETDVDPRPLIIDASSDDWLTWTAESGFVSSFMVFNPALEPFDDLDFRHALVAAYDAVPHAERGGRAVPVGLAPLDFARPADPRIDENSNAADAVSTLAASTHKDVRSIVVHHLRDYQTGSVGFPEDFSHVFRQWLDELDIAVEQVGMSSYDFGNLAASGQLGVALRNVKLVRPDPLAAYTAVAEALSQMAASSPLTAKVQDMIERARSEPNSGRRTEVFRDVEAYLESHALVLPVVWQRGFRHVTTRAGVRGFGTPRLYGSRLASVTMDLVGDASVN